MFERWIYLQDGRPRVGRSRHLLDFFELGPRVAFALELAHWAELGEYRPAL